MTENEAKRAAIVARVRSGELSLAEAQALAARIAPLPQPQDYYGFAGMSAAEMSGES